MYENIAKVYTSFKKNMNVWTILTEVFLPIFIQNSRFRPLLLSFFFKVEVLHAYFFSIGTIQNICFIIKLFGDYHFVKNMHKKELFWLFLTKNAFWGVGLVFAFWQKISPGITPSYFNKRCMNTLPSCIQVFKNNWML